MGQQKKFSIRQLTTVEPVIFAYGFALFMHQPVIQQYIYSRIAKSKGLPYDIHKPSSCANTTLNHTMIELEKEVQSVSSYVHLGVVMFSSLPSLFTSLMIGSWSDTRGRKPALFLPALGSTIEAGITVLVMYMEWPVYVLFIGGAINGVCGYFTTIIMGVMAYIADTTDESQRSLRLAVLELITFMGGMVSQLASGVWIQSSGFITPYWFILGCLLFSLIYIVLFVPESRHPAESDVKQKLFSCQSLKRIYNIYTTPREGGKRNLFLLTFSSAFMQIALMGVSGVIVLFILHTPLCFSPEFVGYFTAWRYLSIGLGAILGIKLLGMCLSELTIARLGILTQMGSLVLLGFSKTNLQVFMVPLAGLFNGCSVPIFRAMMSRIVTSDEQGALFSAIAALESLSTFLGAFMFNTLYPASLKVDFPAFAFLVGASVTVLPFFFTFCLKNPMSVLSKRDRVQIVGNYEQMPEDNLHDKVEGGVDVDEASPIRSSIRQRGQSTASYTEETPTV